MPSIAQRNPKSKYSKVSKFFRSFSVKIIDKQKELVYATGCNDRTAPTATKPDGSETTREEAAKGIGRR
jgi:hypothetical protein